MIISFCLFLIIHEMFWTHSAAIILSLRGIGLQTEYIQVGVVYATSVLIDL
jgi:hypothetical protein